MARARTRSPAQRERERARQQRESRARRQRLMLMGGGAAILAVVALILIGSALRGGSSVTPAAIDRDGRILGSPQAPVTLTAWEDFQCPFCKQANDGPLAQIVKDYVEPGKVKLEYRHMAFLGDESVQAAEASECASVQGRFWEYHDILFAKQAGENRGAFADAKLKQFAADAGLDQEAFNTCLDSGRYKKAVEAETAEGEKLGVTGTPTFFVNGRVVTAAPTYGVLKDAIEKALIAP